MSSVLKIRPLTSDDRDAVRAILDRTGLFPADMLDDMVAPFLGGEASHLWLAALSGGTVVGFAYCETERTTDGTHNLLAIAVDPDRQKHGIGKAIVRFLEAELAARGGRVLIVETSSLDDYVATRAFYERQNFVAEAEIRHFYAEGENKIVFWKRLAIAHERT